MPKFKPVYSLDLSSSPRMSRGSFNLTARMQAAKSPRVGSPTHAIHHAGISAADTAVQPLFQRMAAACAGSKARLAAAAKELDADYDGKLSMAQVVALCDKLGVGVTDSELTGLLHGMASPFGASAVPVSTLASTMAAQVPSSRAQRAALTMQSMATRAWRSGASEAGMLRLLRQEDPGGRGFVSLQQFKSAMRKTGLHPSKEEWRDLCHGLGAAVQGSQVRYQPAVQLLHHAADLQLACADQTSDTPGAASPAAVDHRHARQSHALDAVTVPPVQVPMTAEVAEHGLSTVPNLGIAPAAKSRTRLLHHLRSRVLGTQGSENDAAVQRAQWSALARTAEPGEPVPLQHVVSTLEQQLGVSLAAHDKSLLAGVLDPDSQGETSWGTLASALRLQPDGSDSLADAGMLLGTGSRPSSARSCSTGRGKPRCSAALSAARSGSRTAGMLAGIDPQTRPRTRSSATTDSGAMQRALSVPPPARPIRLDVSVASRAPFAVQVGPADAAAAEQARVAAVSAPLAGRRVPRQVVREHRTASPKARAMQAREARLAAAHEAALANWRARRAVITARRIAPVEAFGMNEWCRGVNGVRGPAVPQAVRTPAPPRVDSVASLLGQAS